MRNRGVLAHKYDVRFRIPNAMSHEVTEATKTYPETVENEYEVTNSYGWSLGGKVTGSAACGNDGSDVECDGKVGVELSGGVKADIVTKFKVKDVKVENRSEDGHPGWLYTITRLPEPDKNYIFWWIIGPLTLPAELSRSTFQPEMTWVWKISDSFRDRYPEGLPIIVEFTPELVHCHFIKKKYWDHAKHEWKYYNYYQKDHLSPEKPFSVQVSLPWPATKAFKTAFQ